ncbi:hypothetical protein DSO57_1024480 [Entomophthora muscae]|uniref:Uncharacterized protein n=1 Tax=Entomophthora muscae TaxID=34485 RepID=A0ACC2TPV7_9FUNG|nr:hypothetical protein DSO57_1024480 [Entomophthora muscae]
MKSIIGSLLVFVTAAECHTLVRRHGIHFDSGDYIIEWNIASIFLVFLMSVLGCSFPVLVTRVPSLKPLLVVVDVSRHFGTGVILATAFSHMFVNSIYFLLQDLLPTFIKAYSASTSIIVIVSILLMHMLEIVASDKCKATPDEPEKAMGHHCHPNLFSRKRRKLTTYILEIGILSHSVFIGIALGLKKSQEFFPFLIAIMFHQFFEGVGLGARIAEITFKKLLTPITMVVAYSLTTSVGITIGVVVHGFYERYSVGAILVEGLLDAISAGILIYTALVELIGRDLSHGSDFSRMSPQGKLCCLVAFYAGALSMIIIAAWA